MPPLIVAVACILFLPTAFAAPTSPCDNSTHFDCQTVSRRCIPLEWICDNIPDCTNGKDESHCSYLHECPVGTMVCRHGECVDRQYKCDGEADCIGGTDELGCDGADVSHLRSSSVHSITFDAEHDDHAQSIFSQPAFHFNFDFDECLPPMYQCTGNGPCIVSAGRCDGEEDCPNGDDEFNCGGVVGREAESHIETGRRLVCRPNSMLCHDETACIPVKWVCDGTPDCDDESDELNCNADEVLGISLSDQANALLCGDDEYRCVGQQGICLPLNQTCDGKQDCPQGDDETDVCQACHDKKCHHACRITQNGARCYCPPGAEISIDGVSCSDVDECKSGDGRFCQHYCENMRNSFHCSCAAGYMLGNDGHSCRVSRDHEGHLLLSMGGEVREMPLFDEMNDVYRTTQTIMGTGVARSLDFFQAEGRLFAAISGVGSDGELSEITKDGLVAIRENVTGIGQVAVDWIGKNLYFTQKYPSETPGISVCTMNGFHCKQVVRGLPSDENDASKRQSYRGLVLHPQRGLMMWIESYNGRNRIMKADMDGNNIKTVLDTKLGYPHGLALDTYKNELYFGDVEDERIAKVNIDRHESSTVISNGVHHPFALAFFNGFLYWTDWGTESLKVAEISHHFASSHVIHSFHRFPYGIAVNHSMFQPAPLRDMCASLECAWMCVNVMDQTETLKAKCICPDNYGEEDQYNDCVPKKAEEREMPTSHAGVQLMKDRCEKGEGCLHGGACVSIANEHGRVTNIVCECISPYEGDHCERYDESQGLQMAEELSASNDGPWMAILLTILIILLLGGIIYITYVYQSYIGGISEKLRQQQARMNRGRAVFEPVVSTIRDSISKLRSSYNAPSSAAVNMNGAGIKDFSNPLFAPEEEPNTSSSSTEYANEQTNAAPFSGYEVSYSRKFVN